MKTNAPARKLWRSLDDQARATDFRQNIQDEFIPGASEFKNFDRRHFLKLMGASIALAGVPACTRQPVEKIVPYVNQPEQLVPGKPLYFATTLTMGGFGMGLLVESHEGHPTKIEGNPGHPASLGATNIFHQAALLDLYDPARSKIVLNQGKPSNWNDFIRALRGNLQKQAVNAGSRLRILTETVTSPTLFSRIQSILKTFPQARWHQYEPVNRDNAKAGALLAFGETVETHYHFAKAKVILSLDSDFLFGHPASLRYIHDFSASRRARLPREAMSRLYVVESSNSITGANADHRLPMSWSSIQTFARDLAQQVNAVPPTHGQAITTAHAKWILAIAQDLLQNRSESVVIAGDNQPPNVHALAHSLNHFLGNTGNTVTFAKSAEASPINQLASLRELTEDLVNNRADTVIIIGGNPVFNSPVDFNFDDALAHAHFRVHLSPEVNETSRLCDWHIPENHFLESWGDARAFDGTISLTQPLIVPLYHGKSALELVEAMIGPEIRTDYDIVRDYWRSNNPEEDFDRGWNRSLHDGLIQASAFPKKDVSLRPFEIPSSNASMAGLEITFLPDPTVWDGRFANNAWLQELPKPITKLVWDNAALISPELAQSESLSHGDMVEITVQGRTLSAPVWIVPGQPAKTIGLQFGYGRSSVGLVGAKTGSNSYTLRTSDCPWGMTDATMGKTSRKYPLVTTQDQHVIDSEERQIIREGTFAEFQNDANFVRENSEAPSTSLFVPA